MTPLGHVTGFTVDVDLTLLDGGERSSIRRPVLPTDDDDDDEKTRLRDFLTIVTGDALP